MQKKFKELTDYQWLKVEKYLDKHKPKKHDIRVILNAILWITRTGCQWRNMESVYPKWKSVYYYFNLWSKNGVLGLIMNDLVKKERRIHKLFRIKSNMLEHYYTFLKGLSCQHLHHKY